MQSNNYWLAIKTLYNCFTFVSSKLMCFTNLLFSSVQLLGDLLYRISGVSGKMSTETANEDDNFGTEQSHKVR